MDFIWWILIPIPVKNYLFNVLVWICLPCLTHCMDLMPVHVIMTIKSPMFTYTHSTYMTSPKICTTICLVNVWMFIYRHSPHFQFHSDFLILTFMFNCRTQKELWCALPKYATYLDTLQHVFWSHLGPTMKTLQHLHYYYNLPNICTKY